MIGSSICRFVYQLFDEEQGVSPVIGVILMVAITVILAAVIGAFALGFGDQTEDRPQVVWGIDLYDETGNGTIDNVTLTHKGGSQLDPEELSVVFVNDRERVAGSEPIVTGSTIEIELNGSAGNTRDELKLVWSSSKSGKSSVILRHPITGDHHRGLNLAQS